MFLREDGKVTLVAEVGTTANGDVGTAKQLADAVKAAGCDWIKWMILDPDGLIGDRTLTYTFQTAEGERTENLYDLYVKAQFSEGQLAEIVAYCHRIGLPWFASVDTPACVDIGERLGCPAYKISSWEITHRPLLGRVAATGDPVLVDLGPATEGDVLHLQYSLGGNPELVWMHTSHASDPGAWNLQTIAHLRERGFSVGWSCPDDRIEPDGVAIALGASVLERRVTLSRTSPGHHHWRSTPIGELAYWVQWVRGVEAMLGRPELRPSPTDQALRQRYMVSQRGGAWKRWGPWATTS